MSLDVWKFVLSIAKLRRRTPIIRCDSGAPATNAALVDVETKHLGGLSLTQTFICQGGVTTVRLLQLTRRALLEEGQRWGGNVLINEFWTCEIYRRKSNTYEVKITYEAVVGEASKESSGLPIAAQEARGVPGMMTILECK